MIFLLSIYLYKIDKELIYKYFKFLLLFIICMSGGYNIDDFLVKLVFIIKQFMNEFQIVLYIKIKFVLWKLLCLNDEEIWMFNLLMENIMNFYNIDGDLVQLI